MQCKAVRQFDEMYCHACDLRWDAHDDDEPPACKGKAVQVEDGFIERVCKAFDISIADLARFTKLSARNLNEIKQKPIGDLADTLLSNELVAIREWTDRVVAAGISVGQELDRKIGADMTRRAIQRDKQKGRS